MNIFGYIDCILGVISLGLLLVWFGTYIAEKLFNYRYTTKKAWAFVKKNRELFNKFRDDYDKEQREKKVEI